MMLAKLKVAEVVGWAIMGMILSCLLLGCLFMREGLDLWRRAMVLPISCGLAYGASFGAFCRISGFYRRAVKLNGCLQFSSLNPLRRPIWDHILIWVGLILTFAGFGGILLAAPPISCKAAYAFPVASVFEMCVSLWYAYRHAFSQSISARSIAGIDTSRTQRRGELRLLITTVEGTRLTGPKIQDDQLETIMDWWRKYRV